MQEECSVDTVQMLVGQLKTREQELAKKGRIVDYEPRSDFYAIGRARTRIHDLDGADAAMAMAMDRYPRRLTTRAGAMAR